MPRERILLAEIYRTFKPENVFTYNIQHLFNTVKFEIFTRFINNKYFRIPFHVRDVVHYYITITDMKQKKGKKESKIPKKLEKNFRYT